MASIDVKQSTQITVTCPHCQQENKTKIWTSVNSNENPKITQKILDDSFFIRKCSHCGEEFYVDHTVIFKDEDSQCIVCYTADPEGESFFVETIEELMQQSREEGDDCIVCPIRIVKDKNQFREKARIFYMGLDDHVIEVIKVWALEYIREQGINDVVHYVLCWVCDDGTLEITFLGDTEENYMLMMPIEQYNEAMEDLYEYLDEEEQCYIDMDWAINFVAENDL